jgi:hypothetical protein
MAEFPFPLYSSYTYPSYPPISPFYPNMTTAQSSAQATSPSLCFNYGYTPPTPAPYTSSTTYFPIYTYEQQPQTFYSPLPNFSTPSLSPNSYPSYLASSNSYVYGYGYPNHYNTYQLQPHHPTSHSGGVSQTTAMIQKSMTEFSEASRKSTTDFREKMETSRVALKASFQHLSDLVKTWRENLVEENPLSNTEISPKIIVTGGSLSV